MSELTPHGNTSKKVQRYIEQCIITWVESFFRRTLLSIKRSKNFFYFFLEGSYVIRCLTFLEEHYYL